MSVGKVCIKRFEFTCMTILSPETVSIRSIMDMQVPPNQPKMPPKCIKNAHRGNHIYIKIFLKKYWTVLIYASL